MVPLVLCLNVALNHIKNIDHHNKAVVFGASLVGNNVDPTGAAIDCEML